MRPYWSILINISPYRLLLQVKARRSCVKAREEEEARKQQEALEKFSKLKAQRAKKEERKALDTTDDDMSDGGKKLLMLSTDESDTLTMKKKSSLILSSSENDDVQPERRRKKKTSSGSEKKKSGLSKMSLIDSSEDSDAEMMDVIKAKMANGFQRSKPSSAIYSSDEDDTIKSHQKSKNNIYSDSESNTESKVKVKSSKSSKTSLRDEAKTSHNSGSESEPGQPKSSALAVLAKGKKKSPVKDILDSKKSSKSIIKTEPLSSESEPDTKPAPGSSELNIKKEIKTEIKIEPSLIIKSEFSKKKSVKKEKKRDKEYKEKDKSLLGQKMAKIFGTSSEDESFGRNSKPPTPNTSLTKPTTPTITKPLIPKLNVDQVFSASSDGEKEKLNSPALMSDSDDEVPSRPPTPTFQTKKVEELKPAVVVAPPVTEEVTKAPAVSKPAETKSKESALNLFDSSEDEMAAEKSEEKVRQELDRNRRLSAHERQKQSENLFDSLLTVNVDLPAKMSRKSPGGSLKSPGGSLKSPGGGLKSPACLKSPGIKSGGKYSEPQKSPGSHRSPLLSPGGKPTYLLAHTFNKAANREAEKRHKEQELTMFKHKAGDKVAPKPEQKPAPAALAKPLLKISDGDTESALDVSEIKILEEKIQHKPKIMDLVPSEDPDIEIVSPKGEKPSSLSPEFKGIREMKYEEMKPIENKRKVSTEDRSSLSGKDEKPTESASSLLKTDTSLSSEGGDINSSAESGYAMFAHGTLDAASSPSPASDYEEGRLVIGDGDDTDTEVVAEQPTKPSSSAAEEPEIILEHINTSHGSENKVVRIPEPTREEQLEKSIASITSEMEISDTSISAESQPSNEPVDQTTFDQGKEPAAVEAEPPVKRTVISQEETESAVNALLGESFDSFDTEEPTVANPVESVEVEQGGAGPVDDEAAAAVAGLGMDMSPPEEQTNLTPPRSWPAREEQRKPEPSPVQPEEETAPMELSPKIEEKLPTPEPEKIIVQEEAKLEEEVKEVDEVKKIEPEPVVEDLSHRGRGRGRGVQRRGRGAVVTLVQTSTPIPRGRGRGARSTRGHSLMTEDENEIAPELEKLELLEPGRGRGGRGRVARGAARGLKRFTTVHSTEDKSHDVFEFQESDEELSKTREPLKSSVPVPEPSPEKKVEAEVEAPTRPSLGRGRGRGKPVIQPQPIQTSPKLLTVSTPLAPVTISTVQSSPNTSVQSLLQTMSPMQSSPVAPLRLSTDEKLSPTLSPGAAKSPRMRRSTGGKSRESEEESADTDHKIKLILEQAKQEAAQQAAAHHLVTVPGFALHGGIPITAISSQGPLVSPHTVAQAVSSSPSLDQRTEAISLVNIRTGIPQPTVLPPRHDQQVRPPPRPAAPVRAPVSVAVMVSNPRAQLPIQLPTQPLPPESVRKTQPVLLEQNQPSAKMPQVGPAPRTTIAVSLPTEPVPRSLAMPAGGAVVVSNLPRMPVSSAHSRAPNTNSVSSLPRMPISCTVSSFNRVPVSSNMMVSSRPPVPLVISSQVPVSRQVPVVSRAPAPVMRTAPTTEGQRVSLKQREGTKEPELDQKTREQMALDALISSQQGPVKREYLQPREQEGIRPSSTPTSAHEASHPAKEEEKVVYQQQYDQQTLELYKLRNYRDLTILYNQLIAAGHPEAVAIQYAQSVLRERFLEESRPGSVPPMPLLHHMEEERREPLRQPLPAHNSGPYRQTDSPIYHLPAAHTGSQHPFLPRDPVGPPSTHMDQYRREDLVPPAAHSSQIKRLTHSTAVTDFSTGPQSPGIHPQQLHQQQQQQQQQQSMYSSADTTIYRMPHLAAYPICWSGVLGLKADMANVQMHYVSGCRDLAQEYLPAHGSTLKIVQRMRLEDTQIDGVKRKMDTKSEHCMLLALPHGSDQDEIEKQSKILRNNFITYLQLKSAAGIVNVFNADNQPAIVHVFPSCDFANENLAR